VGAPAEATNTPAAPPPHPPAGPTRAADRPPPHALRKWLILAGTLVGLGIAGYYVVPWVITALNTVSTDDAYVNGHVTFLAPRVSGQVAKVFVEDNYRVKKGDVLVQLDKEPYLVQVAIKKAAVDVAETNLTAANAAVRGLVAQARANRFKLEHAIENVHNQIANLRAAVATVTSRKATLKNARADLKRGVELEPTGGISKEELDRRRRVVQVEQAAVDQALQEVYAIRVGLGLPAQPILPILPPNILVVNAWTLPVQSSIGQFLATGMVPYLLGVGTVALLPPDEDQALTEVPASLPQNYSAVRQALGELLQSAAQFGYLPTSWTASPQEAIAEFYKQDPQGNLNRIYEHIIPEAPTIKQAEAKLLEARRDLDQAELNLRYCDVVSEIDGVVTRRSVNPGNNVSAGQSLMAVRSLTEIWIDANFKETQLADLRIGQRVRCEVDMYGSRREYEGRITGFTMGTGQTLALLPPQNATGNFVKIVQRLPVRIDLTHYDPDKETLFVGLSVVPYVYYKEPPEGDHAGELLQPFAPLPTAPVSPKP
jgi:membrane fusion protein (multidrug efflux system)